jgi:glycosyltransferase involved in cell wall biosynthesis
MAAGLPAVATDVGDARVIVGATGMVVPPRDAAALARALDPFVAADPATRRALGEAARTRVAERYSLERCVATFDAVHTEGVLPVEAEKAAGD